MKFVTIIGVEDVRFLLEGDFARFGRFVTIHCFEEGDFMVEWTKSLLLYSRMTRDGPSHHLYVLKDLSCLQCLCGWCWIGCLGLGECGYFHHLYC